MSELEQILKLKKKGKDSAIYEYCSFIKPEVIEIGDGTRIDNFVRLEGGQGIKIGIYSHLASGCSILGGGQCIIGDFSGIAQGVKLVTGIGFPFRDKFRIEDFPEDHPYFRHTKGLIRIGNYCLISVNATVFPNVTIHDGAVVGANSVVTEDVPPWCLAVGAPAKVIKRYPAPRR